MKNIHILPTDKPSRFVTSKENKKCYLYSIEEFKNIDKFIEYDSKSWDSQNIYITSDEEIKEGDWFIPIDLIGYEETSDYDVPLQANIIQLPINIHFKKIILTTDQDLIKDSVQAIDDEFLEWFVNNPSCESIEVQTKITKDGVWTDLKGYVELPTIHSIKYKIIIPKEEPKQENCCTPVGQIKRYLNCVGCDRKPKQETLEHTSKFIAFTLQDSESWIQHSIPLDSFEKADNFCQQFRDRKMSYLICKTLKQGYNGK